MNEYLIAYCASTAASLVYVGYKADTFESINEFALVVAMSLVPPVLIALAIGIAIRKSTEGTGDKQ